MLHVCSHLLPCSCSAGRNGHSIQVARVSNNSRFVVLTGWGSGSGSGTTTVPATTNTWPCGSGTPGSGSGSGSYHPCVVSSSTMPSTTVSPPTSAKSSGNAAIVAGCVGGAFGILILAAIVLKYSMHTKNRGSAAFSALDHDPTLIPMEHDHGRKSGRASSDAQYEDEDYN